MLNEEGILLIDKPTGMTSHDVVNQIRRKTGIKRVGHAGTLDPLATGLLIILVGRENTKRQDEFLKQDKEYECTAQLGIETDTYDSEGKILNKVPWEKVQAVSKAQIESVLLKFTGSIEQTVPAYSAVKIQGQKLYDQARKGTINLETLPKRTVTIHTLELIDFQKDEKRKRTTFSVRVQCSSGTYIRSLIHDIGKTLGVGATVTALRRTKVGKMKIEDAQKIEQGDSAQSEVEAKRLA